MIAFSRVDADGYPTGGGSHRAMPEGAVPLPKGVALADLPRLRLTSEGWIVRPAVTLRPTDAGFDLSDLPEGLLLTVVDMGTAEPLTGYDDVSLASTSVVLPSTGDFTATVVVPRPWIGAERRFVRGAGSPVVAAQALARIKIAAGDRINAAIGKLRLKYVTDIPGQQTIYTEKQAEARAYLTAQPTPLTLADYPLLAAEVGVTAPTAWQLAQVWANKAVLFKQVAAITERLRMTASFAIDAASSEAAIDEAVAASLTILSEGPLG